MKHQCREPGCESSEAAIAARLRSIRLEFFGEEGSHEVARRLGLPHRTWLNYEGGVNIPGNVMLRYVLLTGVEPLWLLEGKGAMYRTRTLGSSPDATG